MSSNWLDLIPMCNGFAYNAAMICEDCAAKTIEHLEKQGIENTGDSNDFPQGPYTNNESDSPQHCDNGASCANAVQIPGGKKIGCPLVCSLTEEGIAYVRRSIAEHILFGSAHQRGVSRLWWSLFHDSVEYGPLLLLSRSSPLPKALRKSLLLSSPKTTNVLTTIFTDLESVYGGAVSRREDGESLVLWKLAIDESGHLPPASTPVPTVQLPISELQERSLEDMLTEAISDGAWD
jgi:hypothetical protein